MASEAGTAQFHYSRKRPGFYGVNPTTGIPVCGPYDLRESALRRIKRINEMEPRVPVRDRLVVKRVPALEAVS